MGVVAAAGDTVVLEYMQRGQLAAGSPDAFPVLRIASVMQARLQPVPAGRARCVLPITPAETHSWDAYTRGACRFELHSPVWD